MLLSLLLGIFLVLGILAFSTYLVGKTPALVKFAALCFVIGMAIGNTYAPEGATALVASLFTLACIVVGVRYSEEPDAVRLRAAFSGLNGWHIFAILALAVSASLLLVHEGKTRARAESAATHELARP